MSLTEEIRKDLGQALKERNGPRIISLRLVLAAIKNEEIERRAPLDDAVVLSLIKRETRRHRESIAAFGKGERQDLVFKEEAELAILLKYLPEQMSRDEIIAAARQAIAQAQARGPSDKGKVMSLLMSELKNKAEGQEVSEVVSALLASLSGG